MSSVPSSASSRSIAASLRWRLNASVSIADRLVPSALACLRAQVTSRASIDQKPHPRGLAMSPAVSRLILVYDANGGLAAMLVDVVKKALGREDCALCEITYSPLGKRQSWQAL